MITAMPHRSRTGYSLFSNGRAALAVAGNYGADSAPSDNCLVAGDIRIDNRDDVVRAVGMDRSSAKGLSDAALVLELRNHSGDSFIDLIEGAFSFVIFDPVTQSISGYRDHFGVRPFYYAITDEAFYFGSEIKSILASGIVDKSLDRRKVEDFLVGRLADQERTFYSSVKRLPPATQIRCDEEDIHLRKYWELDPTVSIDRSDDELVEEFRSLFTRAVEVRMSPDLPVSCMLSGGLDSSSVVAVAGSLAHSPDDIHTYSVTFPYLPKKFKERTDETAYAAAVIERAGVRGHTLSGDARTPMDTLEEMLSLHDQPFEVPNAYLDMIAMSAVRERGPGVLLTGLEGDLTISHGDGYLKELAHLGRWREFKDASRALAARSGADEALFYERYAKPVLETDFRTGKLSRFWEGIRAVVEMADASTPGIVWTAGIRPWARSLYYSGSQNETFEDSSAVKLFKDDYAGRHAVLERLLASARPIEEACTQREIHIAHLESGYAASLLEFSERNAAFHGLDIRHPFFDKRLVEFSVALPGRAKLSDGWTRYILRMAMEQNLPESVCWRTHKAALGPNFVHLMKSEPEGLLRDLANHVTGAFPEMVDKTSVNNLLDRRKYATLWTILVLGKWILHNDD